MRKNESLSEKWTSFEWKQVIFSLKGRSSNDFWHSFAMQLLLNRFLQSHSRRVSGRNTHPTCKAVAKIKMMVRNKLEELNYFRFSSSFSMRLICCRSLWVEDLLRVVNLGALPAIQFLIRQIDRPKRWKSIFAFIGFRPCRFPSKEKFWSPHKWMLLARWRQEIKPRDWLT